MFNPVKILRRIMKVDTEEETPIIASSDAIERYKKPYDAFRWWWLVMVAVLCAVLVMLTVRVSWPATPEFEVDLANKESLERFLLDAGAELYDASYEKNAEGNGFCWRYFSTKSAEVVYFIYQNQLMRLCAVPNIKQQPDEKRRLLAIYTCGAVDMIDNRMVGSILYCVKGNKV